ncbi:MAG TPA: acireductone synthase [Planctomycetota bacterium]|nr:acireductone synthase [Planctomycetota bacterium]
MVIRARGVLLDIEGTTSSIRYVYDVLVPFARKNLRNFLQRRWSDPAVQRACETIARDAGAASFKAWTTGLDEVAQREKVATEVERLMDADVKATGLKELQGLIWDEGYSAGKLTSHVYPDVAPALKRWAGQGRDIRIYSSGSVAAQKVFFKNTDVGDLTVYLRGHYDTTTGPKRDPASYANIVADMNMPAQQILFASDVVAELDAAKTAGLQTVLVIRPGNAPQPPGHKHDAIETFDALELA